jgi:hypothetical protein
MKSNAKLCINAGIFLDYVQTVFLLNIAEARRLDEFAKEIAVLLMDNCRSHITSDLIALLTEARVRGITLAPHTTQVIQVLDVTVFDVLKRRPRYELLLEDEKATVEFKMKVSHDLKQTMVEPNI